MRERLLGFLAVQERGSSRVLTVIREGGLGFPTVNFRRRDGLYIEFGMRYLRKIFILIDFIGFD